MVQGIEKMADRVLSFFAPQVTAKAEPCTCGGYGCFWGDECYRAGCNVYRKYWCCNGCQYTYTCRVSSKLC